MVRLGFMRRLLIWILFTSPWPSPQGSESVTFRYSNGSRSVPISFHFPRLFSRLFSKIIAFEAKIIMREEFTRIRSLWSTRICTSAGCHPVAYTGNKKKMALVRSSGWCKHLRLSGTYHIHHVLFASPHFWLGQHCSNNFFFSRRKELEILRAFVGGERNTQPFPWEFQEGFYRNFSHVGSNSHRIKSSPIVQGWKMAFAIEKMYSLYLRALHRQCVNPRDFFRYGIFRSAFHPFTPLDFKKKSRLACRLWQVMCGIDDCRLNSKGRIFCVSRCMRDFGRSVSRPIQGTFFLW